MFSSEQTGPVDPAVGEIPLGFTISIFQTKYPNKMFSNNIPGPLLFRAFLIARAVYPFHSSEDEGLERRDVVV